MRFLLQNTLTFGFAFAVAALIINAAVAHRNILGLAQTSQLVARSYDVLEATRGVLSVVKDAETGQRGFVITGDERYLEPYHGARAVLDERFARLQELTAELPGQHQRLAEL